MSLLVVGLSHRTAPVPLLERSSVPAGEIGEVLAALTAGEHVTEAVVLSTCNRVEIYAGVEKFHGGVADVSQLLAARAGADVSGLGGHLYVHYEDAAVQHLFTVAAGLDSMVVGESQILGQLRAAYGAAQEAGAVGRELHELLQHALRVGKRTHTETGIDRAGASLISVGLRVAEESLRTLTARSVLLVGAGSMGALAAATVRRAGVGSVVVANRTLDNATRLAATVDGHAVGLHDLESALSEVDLLISSTGATGVVVGADVIERAQKLREGRDLVVLDLALPRDVDPAAATIPGVTVIDLEALRDVLDSEQVGQDVAAAHQIVADEVASYLAKQRSVEVAPTVAALRSRADEVVDSELTRLANRLPQLDPAARAEVEMAVHRVVATLLHAPTVRVKELAEAPGGDAYAAALRELFCLDPNATDAVSRAAVTVEPETDPTSPAAAGSGDGAVSGVPGVDR